MTNPHLSTSPPQLRTWGGQRSYTDLATCISGLGWPALIYRFRHPNCELWVANPHIPIPQLALAVWGCQPHIPISPVQYWLRRVLSSHTYFALRIAGMGWSTIIFRFRQPNCGFEVAIPHILISPPVLRGLRLHPNSEFGVANPHIPILPPHLPV